MKRTIRSAVFFIVFLVYTPSPSSAQTAGAVVASLKQLQAKIDNSISYSDFGPALSEAASPVRSFLDSPDARGNPELAEVLSRILQHYETAREIWAERYAGREMADSIKDGYLRNSYHRCVNDYRAPSASSRHILTGEMTYTVEIADCLSRIWAKTAESLSKASGLLSELERKAELAKAGAETAVLTRLDQQRAEANNRALEAAGRDLEKYKNEAEKLKNENSRLQAELDNLKKENETLVASLSEIESSPKKKKVRKK